jgi:DNA-binding MarR family transcriptional regulator
MSENPLASELVQRVQAAARDCLLQRVRRSARAMTAAYEAALLPVDLTASQFSALTGIAAHEGVTVTVLADALGMDRTTLARVLAPLERRGLIASQISGKDARTRGLFLSPKGGEVLTDALPLWSGVQAATLERLGIGAAERLRTDLARLD